MDRILPSQNNLGAKLNASSTKVKIAKDEAEQKLTRSLDRLITTLTNNSHAISKNEKSLLRFSRMMPMVIGANLKNMFDTRNLARRFLKPTEGGILDKIIAKSEAKKAEKENKKEFIDNYVKNTEKGARAFKKDPKIARQQAAKIYDTNKILDEELSKQKAEIDRKNALKERFGYGGASAKDLEKYSKLESAKNRFIEKTSDKKSVTKTPKREAVTTEEEQQEAIRTSQEMLEIQQSILDTLRAIEENTAQGIKPVKETTKKSGGFMDLISGFVPDFVKNMVKGLASVLSPKLIFAALKKLALPVLIVTTLVSGIMDGFEEYKKTGSIGDAIIAGLGGILETLTFGLLDVETVKKSIKIFKDGFNKVVDAFDEWVIQPVMNYVINPLHDFFMSIKDSIMNTLQKIAIPKVEFTIPGIDKTISIGPFEPFKPTEAKPVPNPSANIITQKNVELAEVKDKKQETAGTNTVLSAPVTTVSSTQNAVNFGKRARTEDPLYAFRSL